jgi:hypothetical protein
MCGRAALVVYDSQYSMPLSRARAAAVQQVGCGRGQAGEQGQHCQQALLTMVFTLQAGLGLLQLPSCGTAEDQLQLGAPRTTASAAACSW